MRYFIIGLILFSACQSGTSPKEVQSTNLPEKETVTEPNETITTTQYCFLSYFGEDPNYQDKTVINLTIDGNQVTGKYDWIPAGKDSARGTLKGTIDGDVITVLYDYMIEGSNQQEEMVFKLESDKLLIKKGELHEVEGVLKLKNPATAQFTETVPKVACT